MANTKTAKKRIKVIEARTLRNASVRSYLRTFIRKFDKGLATATEEESRSALKKAVVIIDKAVSKGILHKNNAARKKSRLMRAFNKKVG
ncbi:MAG: 30S ribosomal protein S20 [Eubacteriales bacterium]